MTRVIGGFFILSNLCTASFFAKYKKYSMRLYTKNRGMIDMGDLIRRENLMGLPVLSNYTGEQLGYIINVIFTPDNYRISGIVINTKGLNTKGALISNKDIISLGRYAVIVSYPNEDSRIINTDNIGVSMIGARVLREDGYEIGKVSDILIDSETGRVEGYEISKGFFDDFVQGRSFISCRLPYNNDMEALIIGYNQQDDIKPYNKGIKNIFFNKLE
jgi:uncharacterized protein YrrD